MSEAELHVLKERMYKAKLLKESRGELFELPPIGYVKLRTDSTSLSSEGRFSATVSPRGMSVGTVSGRVFRFRLVVQKFVGPALEHAPVQVRR
jgi:hypothetical protein